MHQPLTNNAIFVFGSNLAGRHGAGAALHARQYYGAIYGQAAGMQGQSYGIPTKDGRLRTLPLSEIHKHVDRFLKYAAMCDLKNKNLIFNVTAIGCGLAGYTPAIIAPMFKVALVLPNINLPVEFKQVLEKSLPKYKEKICTICQKSFTPNSGFHKICCRGV